MKTSQIEKLMSYERNEAGEISIIRINAKDDDLGLIPVRANGSAKMVQSAIYASLDFLRHNMYDHPLTQVGLHFYAPKGGLSNQFLNENVGAVSVNFEANGDFRLSPNLDQFPYGWATITAMNNIYNLAKADNEESFARKHNFIDALIQGYGFEIFVPAYLARAKGEQLQPWAEVMLEQWLETNDAKALKDRNERISRMFDNQYLAQPFVAAKKRGEALTAQDVRSVDQQTEVEMVDGQTVPLSELEPGRYLVYNGNRVVRTFPWDGSVDAMAIVGQITKRGWAIKAR